MTIKYLSLLILFLGPLFTVAQTLVTGVVTDNNNQPVPLANVFLEGTYDGGMSDDKGAFSFETEETGAHTLVVRVIGYREFRKEVVLSGQSVYVEVRLVEEIS
ncbi:MAG: carboxypeptidase-like regulatory domain-containing protein, partial [Bacteroidota bacterium]